MFSLVIINNLHVPGIFAVPPEAYPEPVVDTDAPLTLAFQLLQAVTGRIAQVFDRAGKVQGLQPSGRRASDLSQPAAFAGEKDGARLLIGEGLDHA